MIGKTVSHYKILEKLGEGGMGVVYKAEDLRLGRYLVLKFLAPYLTRDEQALERFINEAKAASSLDHPNICTIYEIGEMEEGQSFIAMAYYEGETLAEQVARGNLQVERAVEIATQIANGLARAHEAGIVHRDLKPANIMVTKRDEVKIVDFGLAKLAGQRHLTKSGSTVGTTAYMSPEQVHGLEADHRSDIWSLGVVMYEMLAGKLPFAGEYDQAILYGIVNLDPEPPAKHRADVPAALEQIVNKALAKKREERYQQMEEVLSDLRAFASGGSQIRTKRASPRLQRPRYLYAGVIALVAALIAGAMYFFPTRDKSIDSIAVLPLDNMTGDPNQEYFVDGMTEALIANLAKISSLRVISRTSIMQYKKARKPLPEIARELNVAAIVEGSVTRANGRVRITAQLIDAPKDRHLWADSYDRDLRDVLALQSEVTTAIAREIHVKLTPQEQQRLTKTRPVNPEAYRLYLQGRDIYNNVFDFSKALEYFQQATQIDPTFAAAYAGIASCYVAIKMGNVTGAMPPQDIFPKAKAAALKALELDNTLGEAYAVLGAIKDYFEWDWHGPELDFKRALELSPQNTEILRGYSGYLSERGRFDESIALMKRAIELDPLSVMFSLVLADGYLYARRYDECIAHSLKMLPLYPNLSWTFHYRLAFAYSLKGMHREAIESSKKAGDSVNLAYVNAVANKRSETQKLLNELFRKSQHEYIEPIFIAMIYTGLGEKDQAFTWLAKAYEEHSAYMVALKTHPMFDPLRSDPRFIELYKKVGLDK